MKEFLTPEQVEEQARKAGMNIAMMCAAARVASSTFYRWKRGELNPTIDVYQRLVQATERKNK